MPELNLSLLTDYFAAAIRIASPLVFAALGGIISERAGVFAVGLEGMMLFGAFTGVMGAHLFGSAWVGAVGSVLGGGAVALLLAIATISFRADQIVCTIALNIFALGLTSFLLRVMFGTGSAATTKVATMQPLPIPFLEQVPFLGPVLFRQPPLTYLAYVLIPLTAILLFQTAWGLNIRAVGENPKAAHAVGVSPTTTRYLSVIVSGCLAGLGGAVLSLQQVGFFTENMTEGRGFIALAAVIFGRWNPWATGAATLLFGAADALQLRIQAFGLPLSSHLVLMLPYIIAILALMGFGGRARYPAAIGQPYGEASN